MFAKVVIGLVLVSIFPCESRHQKFFEVPFDDGAPTQSQSPAPQVPNGFSGSSRLASNQQQFQGNFANHAPRNNHNINPIPNSRRQALATEEEQLRNSALTAALQGVDRSSFHGHVDSGIPPTHQMIAGSSRHIQPQAFPEHQSSSRFNSPTTSFTRSQPPQSFDFGEAAPQPIQSRLSHTAVNTPTHTRQFDATPQFGSNVHPDYQQLNSEATLRPANPPVNTFFGVEEPTVRVVEQPAVFQRSSQDVSNNAAHFIQRAQPAPAVRAPRPSPPQQQLFSAQIPQVQQQVVQQNSRFGERPAAAIPAQAAAPEQSHFFVNQRAPASHEALRRPTSNIGRVAQTQEEREEEIFKQQAQSAQYSFASQIDDSISGNQHEREEVRDGLSVKGKYSYSDGYVKRTVFYEADENGYRVVKQEEEPLGDGPLVNPKGQANVSSYVAGNALQYSITADDIQEVKDPETQQRRQ